MEGTHDFYVLMSTTTVPSTISMQICDPPHENGSEVKNVKMVFS